MLVANGVQVRDKHIPQADIFLDTVRRQIAAISYFLGIYVAH